MKYAPHAFHGAPQGKNIAEVAFTALDGKICQKKRITAIPRENSNRMSRADELPGYVASHEPGRTRH